MFGAWLSTMHFQIGVIIHALTKTDLFTIASTLSAIAGRDIS